MSGPLYTFFFVHDVPDCCSYWMVAYPMRGKQSTWMIVPGTITQDLPDDDDSEPELTEKTHDND